MKKWSLNSWKNYPAKHLPVYQNKEELDLVLNKIKKCLGTTETRPMESEYC